MNKTQRAIRLANNNRHSGSDCRQSKRSTQPRNYMLVWAKRVDMSIKEVFTAGQMLTRIQEVN